MNIYENPPIHNFKGFKRYEPQHLDASSLSELKKCPKRYFLRVILGYTSKEEAIYFAWGSSYHKFREVIEKEYKKKPSKLEADLRLYIAMGMQAGMKLWNNKRGTIGTKYEFMTPERLAETLAFAGSEWIKEKLKGEIEVLETEQPFNVILPNGVVRTGRFDQIIKKLGRLWGRDFKTSIKNALDYERFIYPSDQFAGYTFAEHVFTGGDPEVKEGLSVRGQYVEVMYNDKGTKKEPKRGPIVYTKMVEYTPQAIRKWIVDQLYWEEARKAMRESDHYPMVESQCPWCPFHRVCRLASEAGQESELRTRYKLEIWDPSKNDEVE